MVQPMFQIIQENSDVFGNTSASNADASGLYGAGKFGYSINDKITVPLNLTTDSGMAVASVLGRKLSLSQILVLLLH